jgi:hypothetical protein
MKHGVDKSNLKFVPGDDCVGDLVKVNYSQHSGLQSILDWKELDI